MRTYGPKRIVVEEYNRAGEFVKQERNVMPLSESSLNRMLEHGKTGMVIISANRSEIDDNNPALSLASDFDEYIHKKYPGGDKDLDADAVYDEGREWLRHRNARADKELLRDIKAAGYSYTPVYGGYHGGNGVEDSYEPSYVVYNYKKGSDNPGDFYELERFAIEMCRKYKQESVYVQEPDSAPKYLDGEGNQVNMFSSKDFKLNRDQEKYYTTTKRDRSNPQRFTADIVFENMYIPLRPGTYNERMRRDLSGEYIL